MISEGDPDDRTERERRRGEQEGSTYGGASYGRAPSNAYGGTTYGAYQVPPWAIVPRPQRRTYTPRAGLTGSIEGVVRWTGAIPVRVSTSCGPIESLAIGRDRGIAGVVLYIEKVSVARVLPQTDDTEGDPTIGGVIVKRGCNLLPTLQPVTPTPAALSIHGDTQRAKLTISGSATAGPPHTFDLQEGGNFLIQAQAGITRIDDPDGAIGTAWVIGIDAPYYAVTDDRGRFRIDELGPGVYTLNVLHAPIPMLRNGKLTYVSPKPVQRSIRIENGGRIRADFTLHK